MESLDIRRILRVHGPFVTTADSRDYARRLPAQMLVQLQSFLVSAVANGELSRMRAFVRATPAAVCMVRPARSIYNVGAVVRELALLGVDGFGLGVPFPWDGVPGEACGDSTQMGSLATTCKAWLSRLEDRTGDGADSQLLDRLCNDLFALRNTKFSAAIDTALSVNASALNGATPSHFWSLVGQRARRSPNSSQPYKAIGCSANQHEDRSITITGLSAGSVYSPWRFGERVMNLTALCRAACSATDWATRRDATILICNFEAFNDDEACELLDPLVHCVVTADDELVARMIWSKVRLIRKSVSSERLPQIPARSWDEYERSISLVRRDAERFLSRSTNREK